MTKKLTALLDQVVKWMTEGSQRITALVTSVERLRGEIIEIRESLKQKDKDIAGTFAERNAHWNYEKDIAELQGKLQAIAKIDPRFEGIWNSPPPPEFDRQFGPIRK